MTALTSIKNIGPAFDKELKAAGITTAEQLRALGANDAYRKMLETGTNPHFIGFYVLHMALQGRPWNDCKGEEKKALRKRFDAIKASVSTAPEMQIIADLDAIGVRVSAADLKPE